MNWYVLELEIRYRQDQLARSLERSRMLQEARSSRSSRASKPRGAEPAVLRRLGELIVAFGRTIFGGPISTKREGSKRTERVGRMGDCRDRTVAAPGFGAGCSD